MRVHAARGLMAAVSCSVLLMLTLSGVASGFECPPGAFTINGVGSTLQSAAHTAWATSFRAVCPEVTVSYEASGSAAGLRAWGAEGFRRSEFVAESRKAFIATDDPPEAGQLENIRENANGAEPIVIPVMQRAIAVIARPPRECTITSIRNRALEQAFRGAREAITWEAIGTGSGCRGVSIQRIVRLDAAQTTIQLKHYLYLINREAVYESRTWLGLEASALNTTWPTGSGVAVRRPRAAGDASVVSEVRENTGTLGYADLAEASERTNVTILRVENESGTPVSPRTEARRANCDAADYREALGAGEEIEYPEETIGEITWTQVYGSSPTIGRVVAGAYPICMHTFAVGLSSYRAARFASSESVEAAAHSYLDYIREMIGQDGLASPDSGELTFRIMGGLVPNVSEVQWASGESTTRTINYRNENWFYGRTLEVLSWDPASLSTSYRLPLTTCTPATFLGIRTGCSVTIQPNNGTSPSGYFNIKEGGSVVTYVYLRRIP